MQSSPVNDESALVDALRRGRFASAAIDVFDTEPRPKDHPLRHLDEVVATLHIGYVSRDLYQVFYQDTVANIDERLRRRPRL
jgi:phosphoglycerate dehydrogenase-like enzyme